MRDATGHDVLWSTFMLFFLLYGQLFSAIEQSRRRLNGVSYRWSGFDYEKWTNVREFQDYLAWVSLVFRGESLVDHLHGHLHADCGLLHWLPWNSNNGFFFWTLHCVAGLLKHSSRFAKDQVKATQKTVCFLCELNKGFL